MTDRVLAGVCGGVGVGLRLPPWLIRAALIVLTALSGGLMGLLYIALWWALPQQSFVMRRGSALGLLIVLGLTALFAGIWAAGSAGILRGPSGDDYSLAVVAALLSVVFLFQQLRG